MLHSILFWVVLIWMAAMLVMACIAVREFWRENWKAEKEEKSSGRETRTTHL